MILLRLITYPIIVALIGCATLGAPEETTHPLLENLAKEYHTRVMAPERTTTKVVRFQLSDLPAMRSSFYHNIFTQLGNSTDTTIGICYSLPTPLWADKEDMAIDIDRRLLSYPLLLEAVLWHEMAHCYHGIKHTPTIHIMGVFMPTIKSREDLEKYKRELINYINTRIKA